MSEKRKPTFTMFAVKQGKRMKIEFYNADEFLRAYDYDYGHHKFRIRVNGKWFPKGERRYFYRSEIRDILWRSIKRYF